MVSNTLGGQVASKRVVGDVNREDFTIFTSNKVRHVWETFFIFLESKKLFSFFKIFFCIDKHDFEYS